MITLTDKNAGLPPLSARMKAIAEMVRPGEVTADIGCDHGYISIWLYRKGIAPRCIASDIKEGPVRAAEKNIALYDSSEGVETRVGAGLDVLKFREADTAVIAGMGGRTIMEILKAHPELTGELNLVLSPQSELCEVRLFLFENGFRIEKEDFVKEDDKYYTVLRASLAGEKAEAEEADLLFGPCLLREKNALLKEYLLKRKEWLSKLEKGLKGNLSERTSLRREELKHELEIVNRALEYYE